jgi:hypothetical protein
MKQPRTSDFYPNAKSRDLKSPMEDFPAIEHPQQVQQAPVSDPGLSGRPGRDGQTATTSKRKIKSRHAFDIYEDQVETLQQLSIEDRMRGESGSMSAMVREALDEYIARRRAA